MQTTQPLFLHRGQPLLDEVVALRVWMRVRPSDGSDYLFASQKGGTSNPKYDGFRALLRTYRLALFRDE